MLYMGGYSSPFLSFLPIASTFYAGRQQPARQTARAGWQQKGIFLADFSFKMLDSKCKWGIINNGFADTKNDNNCRTKEQGGEME